MQSITLVNNIRQLGDIRRIPLDELIKTFNSADKDFFDNLDKLSGFKKYSEDNLLKAKKLVTNNSEAIMRNSYLLGYLLKDVYNDGKINYDALLHIDKEKKTISIDDFVPLVHILDETLLGRIFDTSNEMKKGVYSLKKSISPVMYVAHYPLDSFHKATADVIGHSGLFPIDIDIPIDDQNDLLEKVNEKIPIALTLCSPSKTHRIIFNVKIDDKAVRHYAHLKGIKKVTTDLLPALYDDYNKLFFIKIQTILSEIVIKSNGIDRNLELDLSCKNISRAWYLGKYLDRTIEYKETDVLELTDKDIFSFKLPSSSSSPSITTLTDEKLQNTSIVSLTDEELRDAQKEILTVMDEIIKIGKENNYQPLCDGVQMYKRTRDLLNSISNVLTPNQLAYVFKHLLLISPTDQRITDDEAKKRTVENYIVPLYKKQQKNDFIFYKHVYKLKTMLLNELGLARKLELVYYDDKDKIQINTANLEKVLLDIFFTLKDDSEFILYTKDNHLVKQIWNGNIKSVNKLNKFLHIFLDNYFKEDYSGDELSNIKLAIIDKIQTKNLMSKLNYKEIDIHERKQNDTRESSYLFFTNKKLKITKEEITSLDYTKADFILETQLAKDLRGNHIIWNEDITLKNYKFLKALKKITGDEKNYDYAKAIIGYMIHTYRAANKNKCVIILDGIESIEVGTGSGKSLISVLCSFFRRSNVTQSPKISTFGLSDLTLEHQLIVHDDILWNQYDLEGISKAVTGFNLKYEKKGVDFMTTDIKTTPRLMMISNHTPPINHDSILTRLYFFHTTDFFHRKKNPLENWLQQEFNLERPYTIFSDDQEEDWSQHALFVAKCVQFYLNNGIEKYNSTEGFETKIQNELADDQKYEILLEVINEELLFTSPQTKITPKNFLSSKKIITKWNTKLKQEGFNNSYSRLSKFQRDYIRKSFADEYDVEYLRKDETQRVFCLNSAGLFFKEKIVETLKEKTSFSI